MDSFSQTLADLNILIRDIESTPEPAPKRRRPGAQKNATKTCRHCGETDQEKMVSTWCARNQKTYVRTECKSCFSTYQTIRLKADPERLRKVNARKGKKIREDRKNNIRVERFIYSDCRSSDKKFGREFDLTKEFIAEKIAKGCQYCGESTIRMTMDRIDNSIGHLKTNVVPACVRCNYVRRDMPYKAWLKMSESMRAARVAGDFGDWTCEVMRGTRKLRKSGAKVAQKSSES